VQHKLLVGGEKGEGGKFDGEGAGVLLRRSGVLGKEGTEGGGVRSGSVATRREKGPGPGQRAAPAWARRSRAGGPVRPLK
jgi:hypothetical protein